MKNTFQKPRFTQRGVALLITTISIAILVVVATDFKYNSTVELQLAVNQRDETRAYYQARSAIALSRLILRFQKQLDAIQLPNIGGLLSQLGGGAAAASAGAATTPSTLNIQLWRLAKIDCHMLQDILPLKDTTACFDSVIGNEEEKINLAKLDAPQLALRIAATGALSLFSDKRFEFLFDKEDSRHVKVSPSDVVIALHDWIDDDEVQAALNLSGQGDVFLRGFADENALYDRYEPHYKVKNARFDSLDELYLVHGVNDRFMSAFRDRLTVYPDINSRLNINTQDPLLQYMSILAVADPIRLDPRLGDPLFVESLIERLNKAKLFPGLGMSVTDFVGMVEAAGIPINTTIRSNVQSNGWVGDKSTTYNLKVRGEVGSVQKVISTVIRLDDGLGQLLYWREE